MNTTAETNNLSRKEPCTVTTRVLCSPKEGLLRTTAECLDVEADHVPQLIDITSYAASFVTRSGITQGQLVAYCTHTTAALVLNEDEPLLHEDVAEFLESLASSRARYRHDDLSIRTENLVPDHGENAHAHIKSMLLGSVQVLPIVNGSLVLGVWQKLFLLEMDRPKKRTVILQITGIV